MIPCAPAAGIEEHGRRAIRDQANEAMTTVTLITSAMDLRIAANSPGCSPSRCLAPSLAWKADGVLVNDLYLREHLTGCLRQGLS